MVVSTPKMSTNTHSKIPVATPSKMPVATPPKISVATPSKMPVTIPPKMSTNTPPKIPVATPSKMPVAIPRKIPVTIPPKMSTNTPPKIPVTIPPKMSTNTPPKIPVAIPRKIPVATPSKMPVATPRKIPIATPRKIPIATPRKIPIATPRKIPVATPSKMPVAIPRKIPVATPSKMPVTIPRKIPVATPPKMSVAIPREIPVATPSKMPVAIPPKMSTNTHSKMPVAIPRKIPGATPRKIPVATPRKIPVAIPRKIPVATPSKIPVAIPRKIPVATPSKMSTNTHSKMPVAIPPKIAVVTPPKMPVAIPPKILFATPPRMPVATPPKMPVAIPLRIPVATSPKMPVATPPKMPVAIPPKILVATPPKMPINIPSKIPVATPPKMPVAIPPKIPVAIRYDGTSKEKISDTKKENGNGEIILEMFKNIKRILGPCDLSIYKLNNKIILLCGEHHDTAFIKDDGSKSIVSFDRIIETMIKNSPGCVDLFLENDVPFVFGTDKENPNVFDETINQHMGSLDDVTSICYDFIGSRIKCKDLGNIRFHHSDIRRSSNSEHKLLWHQYVNIDSIKNLKDYKASLSLFLNSVHLYRELLIYILDGNINMISTTLEAICNSIPGMKNCNIYKDPLESLAFMKIYKQYSGFPFINELKQKILEIYTNNLENGELKEIFDDIYSINDTPPLRISNGDIKMILVIFNALLMDMYTIARVLKTIYSYLDSRIIIVYAGASHVVNYTTILKDIYKPEILFESSGCFTNIEPSMYIDIDKKSADKIVNELTILFQNPSQCSIKN